MLECNLNTCKHVADLEDRIKVQAQMLADRDAEYAESFKLVRDSKADALHLRYACEQYRQNVEALKSELEAARAKIVELEQPKEVPVISDRRACNTCRYLLIAADMKPCCTCNAVLLPNWEPANNCYI